MLQPISNTIAAYFDTLQLAVDPSQIVLNLTNPDHKGDFTFLVFPFAGKLKQNPESLGNAIGQYLLNHCPSHVQSFNTIKGFLNLTLNNEVFYQLLPALNTNYTNNNPKHWVIEYSSPNTNKPLHLGHIRNNLLGWSVAEILKATGNKVTKVQVINDRGIHICKSMVAWKIFGNGETPSSSGIKGDHLVGKYYVIFDQQYKKQIEILVNEGVSQAEAEKSAPILKAAQEMLQLWEKNDPETLSLWNTMNTWVYEGFKATYDRLQVDFDKNYYESNTYLLGKSKILDGLKQEIFYQKPDGSTWVDLTDKGLDEKILLRADGTSVYITQDIGTAIERFNDFKMDAMVYTVGNEQDYHFKVLFEILKKLGYDWANQCYHLSYGMVDLPTGKMKSREGTVVDADDLIQSLVNEAQIKTEALGKNQDLNEQQKADLYEKIGLSALKYFMLKVDPKKRMLFNPEESIDLQGNTGPFIQYASARISSLLKKAGELTASFDQNDIEITDSERKLLLHLYQYPTVLNEAAQQLSPALIANYCYEIAHLFNKFYQECPILNANDSSKHFRLTLSLKTNLFLKQCLHLLGISYVEKM